MKKYDERYLTIRVLSVCNLIVFLSWMSISAYCLEKKSPLGTLLSIPVLYLEVYEVLYYKKSSKEVQKEVSEKCSGRYGLPFHPYYILIVYGGLCVIVTAITAYFTFLQ